VILPGKQDYASYPCPMEESMKLLCVDPVPRRSSVGGRKKAEVVNSIPSSIPSSHPFLFSPDHALLAGANVSGGV
jgi:hypothetical protein